MVKHFNVMMAALISGTVALFTSVLGVSGTIIGSVLSSFLYQLLSGYSEEKYEEGVLRKPKLANEIVYIFPIVVIGIIELIFLLSGLHYRFYMIFDVLESAVFNNLFRLMGLGLIILGAYPFFDSNNIHRNNGAVVLIVGVLLLLRGLVDITEVTAKVFYSFFAQFDFFFALAVVIALALVIVNILRGSDNGLFKSNEFVESHRPKKFSARKIDTSYINKELPINKVRKYVPNVKNDVKVNNPVYSNSQLDDSNEIGAFEDSTYKPRENMGRGNIERGNIERGNIGRGNLERENVDDGMNGVSENLPLYEEEVILVNNPNDPENPTKKRILKRIDDGNGDDNYQDIYIIDEQ